ncbi:MAG: hypothetical protein KBA46_01215 [Candidatus Omnitrophica bacterium]|nr:hypothetical protein [Candidatus Omnitrophota bacterium]
MMKRRIIKIRGDAIMEYAVVLGLVSLALIAMNVYVKRGIQGRVRDLTQYYLAPEIMHTQEVDPSAQTTTDTTTNSISIKNAFNNGGGDINAIINEFTNVVANSETMDNGVPK